MPSVRLSYTTTEKLGEHIQFVKGESLTLCECMLVCLYRMSISGLQQSKRAFPRLLLHCIAGALIVSTLNAAQQDGTVLSETDVWRVFRVWETAVQGTALDFQPAGGRQPDIVDSPHPPADWAAGYHWQERTLRLLTLPAKSPPPPPTNLGPL